MRTILFCSALLTAAPAIAPTPPPTQLEIKTWEAFKAKRTSEFKSFFSPNYTGLFADGQHGLSWDMKSIRRVNLHSYSLSPFRTRQIDADNVLLTYSADVRGTALNRPFSRRLWVASLWHRFGKDWRAVYHTEIRAR